MRAFRQITTHITHPCRVPGEWPCVGLYVVFLLRSGRQNGGAERIVQISEWLCGVHEERAAWEHATKPEEETSSATRASLL